MRRLRPNQPHWCSLGALGLSLRLVRMMVRPGKLHPMALNPVVVRL